MTKYDPYRLWTSFFGSGYAPFAPGTAGSLASVPLGILIGMVPVPLGLVVLALYGAMSLYCVSRVSAALAEHDSKEIVCDEVLGVLMLGVALGEPRLSLDYVLGWVFAMTMFRVFDALKPQPIKAIDTHVKGAWGVMLDDVAAAAIPCAAIIVFTLP